MEQNILRKLAKPFPFDEVEAKIQVTSKEKPVGMAVFYLDSRAIQNRLDEVVGPLNWANQYSEWRDKSQICGISIFHEARGEWVTKHDGAENSDIEATKGGLTDALKRAAVLWGIGRYLYKIDGVWVEIEQRGKSSIIKENQQGKLKAAYEAAVRRIFSAAPNQQATGGNAAPVPPNAQQRPANAQQGQQPSAAPPPQSASTQPPPSAQPRQSASTQPPPAPPQQTATNQPPPAPPRQAASTQPPPAPPQQSASNQPPPAPPAQQAPPPAPAAQKSAAPPAHGFKVHSVKPSGKESQLLELCDSNGEITTAYIKSGDKGITIGSFLHNVNIEKKTSSFGPYNLITAYKAA
jgi:hypothetical protein